MKFETYKLGSSPRTRIFMVRARGYTFAVNLQKWVGLYGFRESCGGTVSFTFYKDNE